MATSEKRAGAVPELMKIETGEKKIKKNEEKKMKEKSQATITQEIFGGG
jgi:hypothetical protein